ncbi:MAG: hypothetical protein ACHQF0_02080 [Chitinophagales bacterium]
MYYEAKVTKLQEKILQTDQVFSGNYGFSHINLSSTQNYSLYLIPVIEV